MTQERKQAQDMSEELKKRITEFLYQNNEMLVIIADPESDVVVSGYQDQLTATRLTKQDDGSRANIVRDVVTYKGEKDDIRGRDSVASFLMLVDGSVLEIAKRIAVKKKFEKEEE